MTIPHPNLFLAREAQNMAKNASGRSGEMFQTVALVSMCTIACASGMQVLLQLWRELNKEDKSRGH